MRVGTSVAFVLREGDGKWKRRMVWEVVITVNLRDLAIVLEAGMKGAVIAVN